jgi:spore coat protein U-like protein
MLSIVKSTKQLLMLWAMSLALQDAVASSNANLQVTATVLTTCAISPAALAFGNYVSGGANVIAQTNVGVICSGCDDDDDHHNDRGNGHSSHGNGNGYGHDNGNCVGWTLTFDYGQNHSSAPGASYAMKNGTHYLRYAISDLSSITSSSTWPVAGIDGTGTGSLQNVTVYGLIPGGQVAAAGSYADTIVMTLSF